MSVNVIIGLNSVLRIRKICIWIGIATTARPIEITWLVGEMIFLRPREQPKQDQDKRNGPQGTGGLNRVLSDLASALSTRSKANTANASNKCTGFSSPGELALVGLSALHNPHLA